MLQNNIDARAACDLSHFDGDLLLVVVDHVIGAEFAGALHLSLVSGSGNHDGVEEFRNLDRGNSYT